MNPHSILSSAYSQELADHVIDTYTRLEQEYILGKWKSSEVEAGHFVESVRRILELELFGKYTPLHNKLESFNHGVLQGYEQASGSHESFRMLIPQILKSMYNIRNKRGAAHVAEVSPNEMDATYILHSAKWVLAELIRLKSNLYIGETQVIVSDIVETNTSILWKENGITRVLNSNLSARQQILILLYDNSPRQEEDLLSIIEYSHKGKFRQILCQLHKSRFIEYGNDGSCKISPKGRQEAEEIINQN